MALTRQQIDELLGLLNQIRNLTYTAETQVRKYDSGSVEDFPRGTKTLSAAELLVLETDIVALKTSLKTVVATL